MESNRTQPVLIVNAINEVFTDQCSLDDNCWKWQHLEQFWGDEKHRLQDVDGQLKTLSSSFEEHLLHDNFLDEPERKPDSEENDLGNKTVRGEEVSDVPTTHVVKGFGPQELIAVGTYVDKNILPGFRYKVRKNLTEAYLFKGKAKYLDSIGLGYGKRITFEGDTLNENENYFWSDSSVHGYGFTLQTITKEDVFSILDMETGHNIGRVLVRTPSTEDDNVLSIELGEHGYVEKEVAVQFSCDVILNDNSNEQTIFVEDVPVRGKATVVRERLSSKAKVNQISLDNFILDSCLFVTEE